MVNILKLVEERRKESERKLAADNARLLATSEATPQPQIPTNEEELNRLLGTSDEEDGKLQDIPPAPKLRSSVKLNEKQQLAITTAINEPYSNIIGYAGSGKTTAVMQLVEQMIESGKVRSFKQLRHTSITRPVHLNGINIASYNFAMVAFTGLAVKALRKSVPNEYKGNCYTIHKLIDFGPSIKEVLPSAEEALQRNIDPTIPITKRIFEPRCHGGKWLDHREKPVHKNHPNKAIQQEPEILLPFDLVIIDEASMVGVKLWSLLIDALPAHCRIITIGDIAQIPPVLDVPIQPVLMNNWPTTELTEIYRQKDGDMISNANAIRQGKNPVISDNFKILKLDKEEKIAQQQTLAHIKKCYNDGSYDPKQDILITPMNVGLLGQEMLNVLTRPFTNPNADLIRIKTMRGQKILAVDDRVMNIKNDNEMDIYNGMLGWCSQISINAGMGRHHAGSKLEGFDSLELDVGQEIQDMQDRQAKEKQMQKVNRMFGGALITTPMQSEEEEEEGTGIRKASHIVHTQFDYELEDDPDGSGHFKSLGTSSQLENLIPAWWITIHKSQGSGFRNVFIVLHNSAAKMLCNELLYTAVTRCVENVTILTTNYAFKKCVTNQRIVGATLEEKITSYCGQFDQRKYGQLFVPTENYFDTSGEKI